MTTTPTREFVSREEFESFERNVEQSFRRLGGDIERVVSKLDAISRPSYGVMGTFAGLGVTVIALVGSLAAQPFLRDLERLERRTDAVEVQAAGLNATRWSRDDHERFQDQIERTTENLRLRVLDLEKGFAAQHSRKGE